MTAAPIKPETALALEEIAGHDLDGSLHGPFMVASGSWPVHAKGVYIVFDLSGECAYVGKVCSDLDKQRLAARFKEHLTDPRKFQTFNSFYVLPVKARVRNGRVEVIEGWVAQHLRPRLSRRSPNPARRASR